MAWNDRKALLCVILAAVVATAASMAKPGCQSTCGNLTVPYPFGMGFGCYMEGFEVYCNLTTSKAYVFDQTTNMEIIAIFLFPPRVRFLSFTASQCYNSSGLEPGWDSSVDLENSPYMFSDTENIFVATGCDTAAFIEGTKGQTYSSGCISQCDEIKGVLDGECPGIGCCKNPIPKGLKNYSVTILSFQNHSNCIAFNPCSYAFMVDRTNYTFLHSDLSKKDISTMHPTVLDWSIGNQSCQTSKIGPLSNTSTSSDGEYACLSDNSSCVDATNSVGYICRCSDGYAGNPYLQGGCKDIDECVFRNCKGVCTNIDGNYTCTCPPGSNGNAMGDGCFPDVKEELPLLVKLVPGIVGGVLLFVIIISWIYLGHRKVKFLKMKEEFFKHNGGLVLQEKLSLGQINNFTIYPIQELKKATNNFDKKNFLGEGGNGVVYKGTLRDDTIIAIKRCKMVDDKQNTDFSNEMIILSQINHANVVKLLGCCLEERNPSLIYEFVSEGSLFHLIHSRRSEITFPWDLRLKIAIESAKALSFLHFDVSNPILHGDVKSANILLDENFKAKVSDFGASTLAPKDKTQFMKLVQGTYGYLDPECLQTSQLTLKSDVYSFGVVMAELISGKTALYKDVLGKEKTLALTFSSCVKNNRLIDILDPSLNDEDMLSEIQIVADIAMQCLMVRGDERPTMEDVYMVLQPLRRQDAHTWVRHDLDENQTPLIGNMDSSGIEMASNINMENFIMNIGGR